MVRYDPQRNIEFRQHPLGQRVSNSRLRTFAALVERTQGSPSITTPAPRGYIERTTIYLVQVNHPALVIVDPPRKGWLP